MTLSADLNTVWFILVGTLLTGYAILDGFDLGVGTLHLFIKGEVCHDVIIQRCEVEMGVTMSTCWF